MSTSLIAPVFVKSELALFAEAVDKVLAEQGAKIICGVGEEAAALSQSTPSITFIDGDGNEERYQEPKSQRSNQLNDTQHVIYEAHLRCKTVIRAATSADATLLRNAFIAAGQQVASVTGFKPISGVRTGGQQGEDGFTISVACEITWQIPDRITDWVDMTGVEATGQSVDDSELTNPEQFADQVAA